MNDHISSGSVFRYADTGYEQAIETARAEGLIGLEGGM
jgi:hypothetical protein